MPALRIRLCGEPALLRGGQPLQLPASRKTRALLFLLLRSTHPWRRERLCEMLWQVPNDPRAALRWSLSRLRRTLGEHAARIQADREHVACSAEGWPIDLDAMQAASAAMPGNIEARRILALAEDALEPSMQGLDLPRCPDYEAWLASQRLNDDRIRARLLLRAAELPSVEPARALLYQQTAAALEPGRVALPPANDAAGSVRSSHEQNQTVRYCTTDDDDVRIAYACTGRGSPLVKAANWLNHLELDWESPLWGLLIHELSERHQLIRYDERGNGLSQRTVDDLGFDAFVRDLEVVVDRLDVQRFPLIGLSQGCAVSIEFAARHPERVSALVLVGGYVTGWRVTGNARVRAEREAAITLVRHGWGQNNPAYRQIFSHSFFPGATAEELEWFNEFQRRTASAENAVRFLEAFSTIDVRHRLDAISVPTLVMHSRGDQRVSPAQAVAIASGIRGAQLVTLDSDSHLPLDREPAHARMLDCIHRFLADPRAGGRD